MSTSAVDYFKLSSLKESLRFSEEDVQAAKHGVQAAKHDLSYAQSVLARAHEQLESAEESVAQQESNVEELCGKIKDAEAALDAASDRCKTGRDNGEVVDPQTGLPQGEKILVAEGDQETFLKIILLARRFMAEGNLEKAMDAERISTMLANRMDCYVDPRAIFALPQDTTVDTHATQVKPAGFVRPRSIPDEEELSKTFLHAKDLYAKGRLRKRDMPASLRKLLGIRSHGRHPIGVNNEVLSDIIQEINSLEKFNNSRSRRDDNSDSDNNEYEEGSGDEEERGRQRMRMPMDRLEMNDQCWEAVELAIQNQVSNRKVSNIKELELPHPDSSRIARYNPAAHYKFESEDAIANIDRLQDSLLNCKIRSRPTEWLKETPKFDKLPFEFKTYDISGFDIEEDLIAMCGDKYHNEIRAEKNYVGFQIVPCPTNLDSATTMGDLRDAYGSNDPWDTRTVKRVLKDKSDSPEWFDKCVADAANDRVWASCTRTGTVHAFSISDSSPGRLAKLSFLEEEVKAQSKYINGSFGIVRCGNSIVGSAGTGRLSVWNMTKAVDDFPSRDIAVRKDEASNGVHEDEESWPSSDRASKRTRHSTYEDGLLMPHVMVVDHNLNFACGDLEWLGGSQLLVAPLRDGGESKKSCALRLFDVNAESVVGIFCGTQQEVSIGKQYCVESHNSIFAMDGSVGLVFDVRTFQPSFALHTDECEQILGVPTNASSPVAFTYGSENIKCWDLRMPGSHAYTMATGNTIVKSLMWHKRTSSLLASTRSDHVISYGRYTTSYMYGDEISQEEEDATMQPDYWPRGAIQERSYFGSQWHCDCSYSPVMLQYAFQNGVKMHEHA